MKRLVGGNVAGCRVFNDTECSNSAGFNVGLVVAESAELANAAFEGKLSADEEAILADVQPAELSTGCFLWQANEC